MIKGLNALSTWITPKVNSGNSPVFRRISGYSEKKGSCVGCLAPNAAYGLCHACKENLPQNQWHCRQCALPLAITGDRLICGECLKNEPPFSKVIAPWHYRFPANVMIQRYKYNGQRAYAKPLVTGLVSHLQDYLATKPGHRPDVLIPCPMHPKRRRERGFNQSSDLAEHLSLAMDIPWSTRTVRRHARNRAQRGLDRASRLANLRDAFSVLEQPPARIALIDDVVTTGATVRSLASALKEAGAEDIQVWALARTPG